MPFAFPPLSETPFVSVILAIRNEEKFIARTVAAILSQDYPKNSFELVIADGLSTDATRAVVAETQAKYPGCAVRLIDNPGRIVSPGLNAALAAARGEVIVRVDGHTIIEPDYVRQCVSALQRTKAENVGGRMDPVSGSPFGEAVALATSSPFGVGGARFHYSQEEEWVDTVYLGCWPRAVFDAIGGFDEEQVRNQDDELNYRLRERGGRVLLCPKIRSKYFNRGTPASLWRQYFEYGLWKVRVMQKHPKQMQPRQFIPALFVLGGALLIAASLFSAPARILLLSLAGLYILGAFTAAAKVCHNASPLIPRVLLAFVILHFAYGSGFLSGLARFWNRWNDRSSAQVPKFAR